MSQAQTSTPPPAPPTTKTQSYIPKLRQPPTSGNPNGDPNAPLNPVGAKNTDSCLPLHATGEVTHDYASVGPAPGNVAMRWIYGSPIAAKNRDPRVQVIQYNEDTYLMRQNMCVHWEAPFTYLLFGNRSALLIDTGATADPAHYPLRTTVDAILARWASVRNKPKVPLTVALTSGEDIAQNQGLSQFMGRPDTTLVPLPLAALKQFYKLETAWPTGTGTIDLGDRVIDVLPTPGTHRDGVSFYDTYTKLLFSGDLIYPGKIQIANDHDFVASLQRMKQWADQHPVKYIFGGHIEMQFLPGKAYPRFYTYKPYERVLHMEPAVLDDLIASARQVEGRQMVLVRPDFWLLNKVGPDDKTPVFPEGVLNLNAPRPF